MIGLWEVPAAWRWATLGEVAKVVGGSTPKTTESSYWGGDIPWITPDDLSGFAEKYVGRGDPANEAAVEAFLVNMKTEPRLLFRLAPEDRPNAIRAIDLRVYRGKRADREHQAAQGTG